MEQIIRYITGLSWNIVNNDHYTPFGLTIYAEPEKPAFELFDKVAVMQGIYSSITFTCNATSVQLIHENTIEQINVLLQQFFSEESLEGRRYDPYQMKAASKREGEAVISLSEKSEEYKLPVFELLEENDQRRVILVIDPSKGDIRFSFTDPEYKGIYLPVHAWLDQTIDRDSTSNCHTFSKAMRITKLSFTVPELFNNNYQRYEFWFFNKCGESDKIEEISNQEIQLQRFYSLSCKYLRDLYGREDSVYLLNHDRGSLSDPGTKFGVKWDLPEGQIILIKNSATINGISSLRKAGKSYLEIRIKPRVLNAGKGNCEWIIHRI
ncbi:MAG: hypothetical protein ACK457_07325 [Flavobacteriia bacterium]